MRRLVKMKLGLVLVCAVGCAQPSSGIGPGGTTGHRDGGLQFQYDGGPQYQKPDMAGPEDLAQPAGVDLAAADFAAADLTAGPDLAKPPGPDLAPLPDLIHLPGVENCFNDLDDDGDGVVNNGCPIGVSVGSDVPLIAYGGSGGGAVSAHCPPGKVATLMRVTIDDNQSEIAGAGVGCSTMTLVRGASSYSITVDTPTAIDSQFQGTGWTRYFDNFCDTSMFQVVFWSLMNTDESGPDPYVHGLGMQCGLGTLTLSPTNQLSVSFSGVGGSYGIDFAWGTEHPQACATNQAVVGYNGRDGAWLDQIQPVCAPLVFTYK
jgi:hypothetical protein